ncbi:phosphatase PAP2 family protein [Caulobacter segnis]|uniref:Phosphoesterase PA-phosphatase related protein n=2 Tax=Caulobacter segnis TaxID=88688 RepID=D5VLX4_CAUST|nr:phosphatase PAP2 family protein [Caulobacter segnis]ADG11497.1 phosphoesterase PA-phosphatase related protein [Caulobacter segnis ATCC 21756]AVQ03156.1 phosphatase PAP2 family protein [Caulobacter segnis]
MELQTSHKDAKVLAAAAVGGACAFAATAALVMAGNAPLPDLWVLEHLRTAKTPGLAVGPAAITVIASAASAAASPALAGSATAIVALALIVRRRWRDAVLLAATGAGGVVLGLFLKTMFERERPDEAWRLAEANGPGFPSTQTLFATALALSLALVVRRSTARQSARALALGAAVISAGLVGLSRIYLGVHWTSDVVAAWSAGAAWFGLCGLATQETKSSHDRLMWRRQSCRLQ